MLDPGQTDRQTHTHRQDDYCNPLAHAPRVNNIADGVLEIALLETITLQMVSYDFKQQTVQVLSL